MKTLYSIILLFALISISFFTSCNDPIPTVVKETVDSTKLPRLKVVFIVVGKNIDYNKMNIDEISVLIQRDSILQINQITPELKLNPQIIKVYKVEDITCPYLKKRFKDNKPGELVYEYNDKILIKLSDGVIKVYHSHVDTIK